MFVIGVTATQARATQLGESIGDYTLYPQEGQWVWMGWSPELDEALGDPLARMMAVEAFGNDLQLGPNGEEDWREVPDALMIAFASQWQLADEPISKKKRLHAALNARQGGKGFA